MNTALQQVDVVRGSCGLAIAEAEERLDSLDFLSMFLSIAEICLKITRTPFLDDMDCEQPPADSCAFYAGTSFLSCRSAAPSIPPKIMESHFILVLNSPFSVSL